tara:strand:- start:75 stop:329 length:255 start_codon:yes stop_codon:yes gene_type:complete
MEPKQIYPRVFCHAQKRNVNPETAFVYPSNHFTTMWVELPWKVANSGSPTDAVQWVGEEFNWTFMPIKFCVCQNENEIEELINE